MIEFGHALFAPFFAPTDADWVAAARVVREAWKPGDLIVAAPDFADPLLRQQLGDLLPQPVVGRMDAARFGRIWEISQRGARAEDCKGLTAAQETKRGALTVKRFDRKAAEVTYDFFAHWRDGQVFYRAPDGREVPCVLQATLHQCFEGNVSLRPQLLEIDTRPRAGLSTAPPAVGTTVLEYRQVPMGTELAVGAGLHNVWLRKSGDGVVRLRVLLDGQEFAVLEAKSLSGFTLRKLDTRAFAGRTATVRFEITTNNLAARHLGFVAEARNP